MKTVQTLGKSLFIAASFFIVASCSKDDAPAATPVFPVNNSFVKGKVDGVAYNSIVTSCSKAGSGADALITILGGDLGANSITVVLSRITAPGTYTVNNTTDSLLNYSPGSGGVAYSTGECEAASGTITVTTIDDTHVEGTFSFTGKDTENCDSGVTKTVSEGSFKGTFQNN